MEAMALKALSPLFFAYSIAAQSRNDAAKPEIDTFLQWLTMNGEG
jgi:hypothetical protein